MTVPNIQSCLTPAYLEYFDNLFKANKGMRGFLICHKRGQRKIFIYGKSMTYQTIRSVLDDMRRQGYVEIGRFDVFNKAYDPINTPRYVTLYKLFGKSKLPLKVHQEFFSLTYKELFYDENQGIPCWRKTYGTHYNTRMNKTCRKIYGIKWEAGKL